MTRSACEDLIAIGIDSWLLGAEAVAVIALRSATLAMGGNTAWREAKRMVAEKPAAHLALGVALANGSLGSNPVKIAHGAVEHYHRRVRANRKRLGKPR